MTLDTLERILDCLGAQLHVRVQWQGAALDRLLDEQHAALSERVVHELRQLGWRVETEVSFSVYGERRAIDFLGFHRAHAGNLPRCGQAPCARRSS